MPLIDLHERYILVKHPCYLNGGCNKEFSF